MREAYCQLHQLGHAHSVEVWCDQQLVGGLYGISVGRAFCGESMFHTKTDASKIALHCFAKAFVDAGGLLIDCQVANPHLTSLGAKSIDRDKFLMQLHMAQEHNLVPGFWQRRTLTDQRSPAAESL